MNKLKVNSERLAYWYFRLNGCFTITNFVVHPDEGRKQKTEVDIMAVRLPHRAELLYDPMKDDPIFYPNADRIKVILAEVTTRPCKLNGPWTKPERQSMQSVLRAAGAFPLLYVDQQAQSLYDQGCYEDDHCTMTLFFIGKSVNRDLERRYRNVPQVTWAHILDFIYDRFKKYREQKCRHPQWDETGKALFECAMNANTKADFQRQVSITAEDTLPIRIQHGGKNMKTPEDYIGNEIKADVNTLPVSIINQDTDNKIVYCQRYEPKKLGSEEHRRFFEAGAAAYEIYVICSNNKIDIINHRIEQLQCSHHSHAPHGAPAWIFPEGAMFDIEWDEIILPVRKRMLKLLDAFVCAPIKPKRAAMKRTPKATNE